MIEILLVEDNPGDIWLVQEALKGGTFPCHLSTVPDGEAATDFLWKRANYANAPRPNLILLDLNLPKKNGREVLQEIKADPDLCRIPVMVFSTSSAQRDLDNAYGLHANCYIRKPTDLDEFMSVVKSIEHFWTAVASLPAGEAHTA